MPSFKSSSRRHIRHFWAWCSEDIKLPEHTPTNERRAAVIVNAVMALAAFGLTIWLSWYEYGSRVFQHPAFWLLITVIAYFSLSVFTTKWQAAGQKNTDDKIDELIVEVRGLRDDFRNKP